MFVLSINIFAFDLYVPYDFYRIISISHTLERVGNRYLKLEVKGTYETVNMEIKEFSEFCLQSRLSADTEDKCKLTYTDKPYFELDF